MKVQNWRGLVTGKTPYALKAGEGQEQENLQINRDGELAQRPGMDSIYSANDYDAVTGLYRVSRGSALDDDIVVASKPTSSTTRLAYLSTTNPGDETAWSATTSFTGSTTSKRSPAFCEDRYGRIYAFQGNGVSPVVLSPTSRVAVNVGIPAPTAAPQIVASGVGYFIERVDVLDGGGGYWGAPPITITGGSPIKGAQLKAIVQGGSIVAVDVIDGGAGYTLPPTLNVYEGVDATTGLAWKGYGFLGTGIVGSVPAVNRILPFTAGTGNASTTTTPSQVTSFNVSATNIFAGMNVTIAGTVQTATVTSYAGTTLQMSGNSTVNTTGGQIIVNAPARTLSTVTTLSHGFTNNTADMFVAYKVTATGNVSSTTRVVTITSTNISQLAVGMIVVGTGIAATNGTTANYTIESINVPAGTITLSATPTATNTGVALTFTGQARATWDSSLLQWSATLPIQPDGAATETGGSARITFSQLTDGLSNVLGGSLLTPGGTTVGAVTSFPTATAGLAPFVSDDFRYGPHRATGSLLSTNTDYWGADDGQTPTSYDVDDYTQFPSGSTAAQQATIQPFKWWDNNRDYFIGLTPRYDFTNNGLVVKFNKRQHVQSNRAGGVEAFVYADVFAWDYSFISYRYYTGPADQLNTATDDASKWTWAHSQVFFDANGEPYIDIQLQPCLKTGTTAYQTYSGYTRPTVRVHLKGAPTTWNNPNVTTGNDLGFACLPGWKRTGANAVLTTAATSNLQWFSAGNATTGTLARPVVDFRSASNSTTAGLAVGTMALINAGAGMEAGTFFALQFDNINAAQLFFINNSSTITQGANGGNVYAPASLSSGFVNWADVHKLPARPTMTQEFAPVAFNTFAMNKDFKNGAGRQRFYFTANALQAGALGPPGQVNSTPLVLSSGSAWTAGQTGSITLRQRTSATAGNPLATTAFQDSWRYSFSAFTVAPSYATTSISNININSQGVNYYGAPKLVVTGGGGFGAELDATVANGSITQVTVRTGGTGYTQTAQIFADNETAAVIPVMRPGMKGVYRCAYRYADYSQTAVTNSRITTASGSTTVTIENIAGVEPGFVLDCAELPFPTRIVSIGTAASPNQCIVSRAATATATLAALTVRDLERPIIYSNFSPITDFDTATATSTAPTTLTWTVPRVNAPARAGIVEFFRTSADQSLVFYRLEMYGRISETSLQIVGVDTLTDEQLIDPDREFYAAIPVVLPNGGLNAYRFGVPRSDMAACAAFGDRLWYAVSTSGEKPNSVFFSEFDEFESCPDINEIVVQNNLKSTDSLTALVPFSQYLLAMQNSHCYAIAYNSDPSVDANVQLLANRGVLTQQCCDLFDDQLFCMDERGIYVLDRSGSVKNLSDNIWTFFTDGIIDLSVRDTFFLKVDQRNSTLRAFVALKGSGCTTPHIALCYSLLTGAWWTEAWPTGLTCAVDYRPSRNAQDVPVYGAVDGDIYQFEGTRDYPFRAIASVAITNGGSGYTTTPTVTAGNAQAGGGAVFTAVVQDGVITDILIDRPGYGYGTLTGPYNGGTFNQSVTLTITGGGGSGAAATAQTYPLTVSGGAAFPRSSVGYRFKTGAMQLISDANARTRDQQIDRSVTVTYRPTETTTYLDLREYFNNSPSPRSNVMARDRGTGFVHETTGAKSTLDMSATRSPLGPATGVAQARFAGRAFTDNAGADRHLAVELTGAAAAVPTGSPNPSAVVLYGLEVAGAAADGD